MLNLRLYLLGSPRLERGGAAVSFDSRKHLALISYLALTGQSHTRETLITLLWPELKPSRGRAGLRRNLSVIKKALGGAWLVVDGETVGSDPVADLWLDVAHFRGLLRAWQDHGHPEAQVCPRCLAALTEAVELYQGDFMAGFGLRDSASFDEWQYFQTEGLRQELASALERLVRGHSAQADFESAVPHARRWLALDPLHEPVHRALMELYGRAGQRSAVLRQYDECVQLLKDELGVAPSEETTALYEKLRTGGMVRRLAPRHNLPVQATPFLGRERELQEVLVRLGNPDCRLLTLVGAGGIGKTRLALRAAELVCEAGANDFEHGVYYIRLGDLASAENMVSAVAEALEFRFYEVGEPRPQLLAYLRNKRLLLLMDNMEHLLEGAELLTEVLRTAPGVKLLVTSRVRLGLQGEHLMPVEGMEVPDEAAAGALDSSAIQLFMQGARRTLAGPDWTPTPDELKDVIAVCRLVEGMPLGILLAAAWVEMLTPAEIAAEIGRSLDFLETDLQDLPARQRSMRAVFDHSWRLLGEREASVMAVLSVFRGGFTAEAAREVANASLRDLRALLGKSFLERGVNGRYGLHELLRSYAAEKLDESPDGGRETRDRHCAAYCQAVQEWAEELKGPRQLRAMAEMDADLENVRAAWNRAVETRSLDQIEQAVEGLLLYHDWRGLGREGVALYNKAARELGSVEEPRGRRLLAAVLISRGIFLWTLGRKELLLQDALASQAILDEPTLVNQDSRREWALTIWALAWLASDLSEKRRLLEEHLALCRELEDRHGVARTLRTLGWVARLAGDNDTAHRLVGESLLIVRDLGDQHLEVRSLQVLGTIAATSGRAEEAERVLREAIVAAEAVGDRAGAASSRGRLGTAVAAQGRFAEAVSLCREAFEIYADLGTEEGQGWWRIWTADCLVHLGKYDAARDEAELALDYFQRSGEYGVAYARYHLGRLAVARGAYPEAREQLAAASRIHQETGTREGSALTLPALAYADIGLGDLERAAHGLAEGLEIARQIGAPPGLSLGTAGLALWLADRGEPERAVEIYALASRHPYVSNSRWFEDVAGRPMAEVAASLPPDVVAAAQARGRARDVNATVKELLVALAD